jgi:hypothetical protein
MAEASPKSRPQAASVQLPSTRDDCEICHGAREGVPGNENVVDGKLMCDECTGDFLFKNRERLSR